MPLHGDYVSGEEATIEYALEALNIKNIIVCGHTKCGAMSGVLNPETLANMPSVEKWLAGGSKARELVEKHYTDLDYEGQHSVIVQENVLMQLENLRSLPCVARKIWNREVELHGWVYDIKNGNINDLCLMTSESHVDKIYK